MLAVLFCLAVAAALAVFFWKISQKPKPPVDNPPVKRVDPGAR